nr:hypothetical protein [Enterobacter cloacae]
MMLTFLATFAVFVLVIFGMSLGWIIKRKSIQGSLRWDLVHWHGKGLRLPGTVRCP